MRRRGGVLLTAAVLVPLTAAPALAAQEPVTGYWSRTQVGAPVSVPPPTPVPEGGTLVSGDPAGPVAVTALRGGADAGKVVTGLRLGVADSLGQPEVLVCPTTERWPPERNGRLEAAPTADCSAAVRAVIEKDVLLVELPPALQAEGVDLLLTPEPGSVFSLSLERATAASLVQALAPAVAAPPPAAAPPAPGPAQRDSGASGGFAAAPFLPPDAGVAAPAGPVLAAPAAPAAVGPAPVPQPQAAPQPVTVLRTVPRAAVPESRSAGLLAAALLAGLGALAVRLAAQPVQAPRHLGGGARLSRAATTAPAAVVAPARGVGRFRAARSRPPVRI